LGEGRVAERGGERLWAAAAAAAARSMVSTSMLAELIQIES